MLQFLSAMCPHLLTYFLMCMSCLCPSQYFYHHERVSELQNLYRATFPEEERNDAKWDLDLVTLSDVNKPLEVA